MGPGIKLTKARLLEGKNWSNYVYTHMNWQRNVILKSVEFGALYHFKNWVINCGEVTTERKGAGLDF